jgi:hypothetical protein
MAFRAPYPQGARDQETLDADIHLPRPTVQFRLRSWRIFQRALDPLGPPKPLRRPLP